MKSHLTRSQWIFLGIGFALVVLSLSYIFMGKRLISLNPSINVDPFQATYQKPQTEDQKLRKQKTREELHLPKPNLKDFLNTEPNPSEAHQTSEAKASSPAPELNQTSGPRERARVFLLAPRSQQVLLKSGSQSNGYRIEFQFEVFPKEIGGTLEILKQGKLELAIDFSPTPNGLHSHKVHLRASGLYQWRVSAGGLKGDLRSFTIRP